jgi:hypothetical protein
VPVLRHHLIQTSRTFTAGPPERSVVDLSSLSVDASDALSNLQVLAPSVGPPSTISPPHPMGAGEPLNDTVRGEDFLRTQNNSLSPRQQSLQSQQRRVSFRQYHSESDLPSLASQPPLRCPFSSLIEVQCQKQRRGPQDAVIPVPLHNLSQRGQPSCKWSHTHNPDSSKRWVPFSTIVADRLKTSFLSSSFTSSHSRGSECVPVMRHPPTFHDSFSDTIPRAQLGSSGYIMASATAPGEFGNELYEWSANGTEAREHARHVNSGWKGDTSAKAVLMFVSPLRLILALIIVLIYSKRLAFFLQSSRHLSWKATKCCRPILETGHRFLPAKSLMGPLMSQVAQVVHCRPAQYPLLLPHLSVSTSCG